MEKNQVKRIRVFYMYYWWNGRRERSREYDSFEEFFKACGKWCSENPDKWTLCHRDATVSVG